MRNVKYDRNGLIEIDRGIVYFVEAENSKSIKIGFTNDLPSRIYSLQTGSPVKLHVICSVSCHKAVEEIFHEKFKSHRISGEWFSDCSEIRAEIEKVKSGILPEYNIEYAHDPDEPFVRLYCKRLGGFLTDNATTNGMARLAFSILIGHKIADDGQLFRRNGSPATANDLISAAGMTERSGFRAISSLVKRGILARERDGRGYRYYINPYLVFTGTQAEDGVYERFGNTRWAQRCSDEVRTDENTI